MMLGRAGGQITVTTKRSKMAMSIIIAHGRQRQANLCEFKVILVYIASFRTARLNSEILTHMHAHTHTSEERTQKKSSEGKESQLRKHPSTASQEARGGVGQSHRA